MKIRVSPVTNTIYAGNTKKNKDGIETWTKKEDVTDEAIRAVFEWFVNNSKSDNDSIYQVSFKGYGTLEYNPKGKLGGSNNA